MSACSREGRRPDVDEAKTTSGGAARHAVASRARLTSSRSGALSCTKSTPSTASSRLAARVSPPSAGSGASVSLGSARRALSSIAPTLRAASGSGSNSRTSTPLSWNRAAQPPPITPPPRIATLRGREPTGSAMATQPQLPAHVLGAKNPCIHGLEYRHRPLDELVVGRQLAARQVDVVLQTHPHVAAGQRRHGDVRELHAADRERREHTAGRQRAHHGHEGRGV